MQRHAMLRCATLCYAVLCTLSRVAVMTMHWEGEEEGLVCLNGAPAECKQPELIQQVHQKRF